VWNKKQNKFGSKIKEKRKSFAGIGGFWMMIMMMMMMKIQ
jgi:hypothetical protein